MLNYFLTDRIMCCKYTCNNRCLCIANVYCSRAKLRTDRIADYLSVLNDASSCLANLRGDFIAMGDFNASEDNKFIDYIVEFRQDENLRFFDHVTLGALTLKKTLVEALGLGLTVLC